MHQTLLTSCHLIFRSHNSLIPNSILIRQPSDYSLASFVPCLRGREHADLRTQMPCALVVWAVIVTAVN